MEMLNHHEKRPIKSNTQFNDCTAQNSDFLFIRISRNILGGTQQILLKPLDIEINKHFIFIFIPRRFKSEISYNQKLHSFFLELSY